MKITYLNTGGSVGNQAEWSSPIVIPIGKGLKQELLFEEMGNVTSMTISVYRSGSLMYQQTPVPSATMRIDLSVFAQVLPSLLETYKYSTSNPATGIQEYVTFRIQEGGTLRVYTVYVCSVPAPNLISYGYTNNMGINRCSPTASICRQDHVVSSYKYTFESHRSGIGTRLSADRVPAGTWLATVDTGVSTQSDVSVYTHSFYVENGGIPVRLAFSQGGNYVSVNVARGYKGYVWVTHKKAVGAIYAMEVYSGSQAGAMDITLHEQMLNHGGFMPWVRSGTSAVSPCVGAMTDYRSGNCNVLDTANTQAVRDTYLAGYRRDPKFYFAVGAQNVAKALWLNGENVGTRWSGSLEGDRTIRTLRLNNAEGNVYGWLQFEQKNPNPPLPTCSVLARWFNSKGWYDTMLFEKYTVKPIIDNLQNNEYEVTVQAEANWDNEPCLEWLQRSPDVLIRIPNDISQMGVATLTSTNVFTNVGGEKKKVFQYKFRVKLQKA
ncbi:hypothetical protein BM127P2_00016 [Phocaeicola phage BM127P2]|nr:hypothetical protein BM127P2_00016 [Phocaeicola phage BM127P2]WAX08352.1 hypothetical protein BM127P3_00026 [Phocaeicola phage BM127P3]WAX08389.1 hypothetical protein BM127P4_00016 [Phocaeicola phage BM127P4]